MNATTSTKVRAWIKAAFLALLLSVVAVEIAAAEEDFEAVDPPARVARLSYAQGEVLLAPAGTDEWAEAVLNRPLTSGDRLSLEGDARAELQLDSALIHLGGDTRFGLFELDEDVLQAALTSGIATIRVRRLGERDSIVLETPNGQITLLRPGEYTIAVDPERDETRVTTRTGEAEVLAGDDSRIVRKNETLVLQGLEDAQIQARAAGRRSDFEQWATTRARKLEDSESSRYVSSDLIGYEDLDEHGEWVHEHEYGYVWQPRYVPFDWAPYRYGRWVWISPWGFTWVDDAPWGFAPFHYGRWSYIRHRWCWIPGPRHVRPVYAPALVGWAHGAGPRVGWFPLGPRDVYVPGYRHSLRYIRRVNESNSRWFDHRRLRDLDTRGDSPLDYRFARDARAITLVDRDRFLSGRSLAAVRFGVDPHDVKNLRARARPPALTPYRESVLGGARRIARFEVRDQDQQRQWFPRYGTSNRIPFHAERRAVEANDGIPPSRSQLIDRRARDEIVGGGPKRGGDFRGSAWRAERARSLRTDSDSSPRALHELGTVRRSTPEGARGWRTHPPDTAIDSVARDREARARTREADRRRMAAGNGRLRAPPVRTRNAGQGEVMRERVQRERGPVRMPHVQRDQPRRIDRSEAPLRTNRGNTLSAPRQQAPTRAHNPNSMRSRER